MAVSAADGTHNVLVETELGRDIRDELSRFVVTAGWGLLELKTVTMTLEDVFLRLTQHEEGLTAQGSAIAASTNDIGTPLSHS